MRELLRTASWALLVSVLVLPLGLYLLGLLVHSDGKAFVVYPLAPFLLIHRHLGAVLPGSQTLVMALALFAQYLAMFLLVAAVRHLWRRHAAA